MKTVLVTGSSGFIGRNLVATLAQNKDIKILEFNRNTGLEKLDNLVKQSDFIFHLAGANRPKFEIEFDQVNRGLTEKLIESLVKANKKIPLVISSSIQADLDNPYGRSKKAAEDILVKWATKSQSPVYIYRLPNVFGKWSNPEYNSVVATFCNNIAKNLDIVINDPSTLLTLVYIDDVIAEFVKKLNNPIRSKPEHINSISQEFKITLRELADKIYAFKNSRNDLIEPDLGDYFDRALLATYTSYLNQDDFSYDLVMKKDERGWLTEFIKSRQFGQVFISLTKPGISRGNHWHHTKIEKFLVLKGGAEIKFRDYGTDKVISYKVNGNKLKVLDIPTGYLHSITNTGTTDLITIFWADEILNPDKPDTYYEEV
jgi:UDP-2-acetamido-2,6-beta-L-arabino-hexul-4-ose reductase